MQLKTIKKTVESKMESWLSSIEDEALRKKVKNNLLVTGGCIASMFLNEDINDFDVYIKDRKVLLELVKYYTNPFAGVTILDGKEKEKLVAALEKDYEGHPDFDSIDKINSARAVCLRNLKPDQIKLYMEDARSGLKVNEDVPQEQLNYHVQFFSPNAISLSNKVQIVIRFHGTSEEIHKTFDFIHATNYFTFDEGLVTNIEALTSLLTKQLKYQGSLYPLTSIIRAKKFIKRGFNINAGEYLKSCFKSQN